MELILISDSKLKIMLDESDMKKYRIGGEETSGGHTGRAIRSILECARDRIGFNTEGVEIFVQLYTSIHGGCELFVTKCPESENTDLTSHAISKNDEITAERMLKSAGEILTARAESDKAGEQKSPATKPKLPTPRERPNARLAYSFSSVGEIIKVCKILQRARIGLKSQAFCDEIGRFYLLLISRDVSAYSRLDALSFIVEFGKRENPDCIISYIKEHGKVICEEGAVEALAEL